MEIAILYNKSNQFGLKQDAEVFRDSLRHFAAGEVRIRVADPLEPPVPCQMAIHLEIPVYGWMPWCSTNYLLLNPEWYELDNWSSYLKHFDGIIFRDTKSMERFQCLYPDVKTFYIPWHTGPAALDEKAPQSLNPQDGLVWFLGGSQNKRAAAQVLLPLWKSTYPKLTVYTVKALDLSGELADNLNIQVQDLDVDKRKQLAAWYPGHVCISKAEAFGYTASEAEANGAWMFLNDLDVYTEDYGKSTYKYSMKTFKNYKGLAGYADFSNIPSDIAQGLAGLDEAMNQFLAADMKEVRERQKGNAKLRKQQHYDAFSVFWQSAKPLISERKATKPKHLPPVLSQEDCPPISVVTLLYNRRKFFDLACHNIMLSDYPKDKIEWVIVEDSDDPNESASDRVIQVGMKSAPLTVVYVPLEKKTPISEKRNLGCKRSKNSIILMMDDDDHYPETSFRRRVAWLTQHPWKPQVTACTTIACYDLLRGVSAVNTPPWSLPLRSRISEATLTFYKKFWDDRHFTFKIDIAEGEGFLEGREHEVLEMPPQQIIVAFSHKKNISGRRIPADDAKPGCFWGFPKEFLVYIHKLAGVEVEEEREAPSRR